MRLVAEFEIYCNALPLVEVAATVPEATLILELQFNHGERPLFLVTVTDGSDQAVANALSDAFDILHLPKGRGTPRTRGIRPFLC